MFSENRYLHEVASLNVIMYAMWYSFLLLGFLLFVTSHLRIFSFSFLKSCEINVQWCRNLLVSVFSFDMLFRTFLLIASTYRTCLESFSKQGFLFPLNIKFSCCLSKKSLKVGPILIFFFLFLGDITR